MKSHKKNIQIQVDHIDPLGQGVYKKDGTVIFTGKTLPGECCTVRLEKSKKGVHFAKLLSIEKSAETRVTPECSHFDECPGCDYLHTDYETELAFKKQALKKYFQHVDFDIDQLDLVKAPERLHYRNRIQLHYRQQKIGLVNGLINEIIEIPQCQMIKEELRSSLDALYNDPSWKNNPRKTGHCELYFHDDTLHVTWDKPYAYGGFSQVYEEMNTVLRDTISRYLNGVSIVSVLDLFSGNGNLSEEIVKNHVAKRVLVDTSLKNKPPHFIRHDLYREGSLNSFSRKFGDKKFDLLLLDPPRKGFSTLKNWVKKYNPERVIYVSCHPGTLARDLGRLDGKFKIIRLALIDLFPGTRHFETVAHIYFPDQRKYRKINGST
ncbi:MAG: class I SAM-dependent RNA methyltransferase [Nitrospiria bacterium]